MDPTSESLSRFVEAQAAVYEAVRCELAAGQKASHWMWFVFPQLRSLGRSSTARYFGLSGKAEALAYWQHPLLGARLKQCCELLLAVDGRSALEIFGSTDAMKLRSSMTLFATTAPEPTIFSAVLQKYCDGESDAATLALLGH